MAACLSWGVQIQDAIWWALARVEPWLHNSRLRAAALAEAGRLIHYEVRMPEYQASTCRTAPVSLPQHLLNTGRAVLIDGQLQWCVACTTMKRRPWLALWLSSCTPSNIAVDWISLLLWALKGQAALVTGREHALCVHWPCEQDAEHAGLLAGGLFLAGLQTVCRPISDTANAPATESLPSCMASLTGPAYAAANTHLLNSCSPSSTVCPPSHAST